MNIFDFSKESISCNELCNTVYEDEKIRIERIVSMGHKTPEGMLYDQKEDEWVSVVSGNASIYLIDTNEYIKLNTGDNYMIKKGVKHKVIYTSSPCIWLCIFEK